MTKILTLILTLPLVSHAWIAAPHRLNCRGSTTRLDVAEHENPCWQDIYDEDCSMDNAYAASFVASQWIKSMPCADGIAVRSRMGPNLTTEVSSWRSAVANGDATNVVLVMGREDRIIIIPSFSFHLIRTLTYIHCMCATGLRYAGRLDTSWK